MATEIKIPDLGTTVDQIKLIAWLKQEGEPVKRGEPLCEVETDKAVMELESVAEGVLLRQVVPADTEVEQGTIIAYIGSPGEPIPEPQSNRPAEQKEPQSKSRPQAPAVPRVSPMIRNLAKNLGVDLHQVRGTGPGGTIIREDILRVTEAPCAKKIPMSDNQLAIARRVLQSHREVPAIHLTARIEMSAAMKLRQRMQEKSGQKITYDAVFIFAVSRIIKDFPHFQSHVDGEKIVPSHAVDIGCAVSFDEELYTPIIKDVESKSLAEINAEIQTLVEKVKSGTLSLAEMTGGSMTISNLGMYPVQSFNAIVPPQQSAALSVGATEQVPVIQKGALASKPMVSVTLSVDHRLINGREAAQFLARLKEFIEKL